MKLCENCHTAEVMPVPVKTEKSIAVKMPKSPTDTTTFFFPTNPGNLCYYCAGRESGRITKLGSDVIVR